MELHGVAHVALTVTDLARSKDWYGRVFGWEPVMEAEGDGVRFSVGAVPGGSLLGLRQYDDRPGADFDPHHIGMDHLAYDGGTADGVREWEQRLEQLGVAYTPTQETPYGWVLNFKDPDGIALEIYAGPQQG
jgi:catechol 2,3-dioxygenase-like lactoylglutathione lyase family enzyme